MNPTLHRLLQKHISPLAPPVGRNPSAIDWLDEQLEKLSSTPRDRDFFLAYGACARHFGKDRLPLDEADLSALAVEYPNFGATQWPADQMARTLLLTALPADRNVATIDRLAGTADVRETIALYKGLYFLENAADFVPRAREGLRTNMTSVFDAIALDNPFPAEYLPQDAWNQMVLKAMFMERPMYRIYRIEDRKNARLARIFLDFADERRAAHRPVSPELWRFVAGYVDDRARAALEQTHRDGNDLERQAAELALAPANAQKDISKWDVIGRQANE